MKTQKKICVNRRNLWFGLLAAVCVVSAVTSVCAQEPARPLTIVAFGDSTTAVRRTVKQVYVVDRLPALLKTIGIITKVINAGVGGSHTGRLADNARHKRGHALGRLGNAVRHHKPDIVLIQFGWNDSWVDSDNPNDASRISVEKYSANLKHIAKTLIGDGARVILMTPNRPNTSVAAWRVARTLKYVEAARRLAKSEALPLVDVWREYERIESIKGRSSDELLLDSVHPNDKGHALVARLLSEKVAQITARPNVLFILVDDLGWSDVGFNGSKVYETPNVDRLARQGMVLSDFYSGGPVCSPTRASIMTGKYTARTGITTYLLSPTRDAKHLQSHLPLEEFAIAEAFKKNGFATGYFGKWHLGYENKFWASNQGFDVAKGGIDLPWAWTLCYPDIKAAPTAKIWPKQHTRFFSPYHLTHLKNGPKDEYLTERLTDETIAFIEKHRGERFFAFLSFHTVHTPLQAKPEKIVKYKKKIAALGLDAKTEKNRREKSFQNNAAYAAMVEHMDENVGRLLARLDELKLSDNTIVVWTSDNGGKGSVTSNLPLRGMKHNLYEGGIRVPTIVRWPKQIAAGASNATPLISNDFYPTLLELAGCPAEPQQHVDGISFKNVLFGKTQTVERSAIYWHYPHSRQEAAIRAGKYKLLHRFKQGRVELYDLKADLGERTDLSKQKPEVAARLLAKLKLWQKNMGAKYEGDTMPKPRK